MKITEAALIAQIDAFLETNRENIIDDIAELISVRSVAGPAEPGAPFGPGPRKALNTILTIAKRHGLQVDDGRGFVGWAQVPGKREDILATITHVDIVPEGEGWAGDPLRLRQKDGWLIGRGTMDDKGPAILCLYAAKFLNELEEPLRYTFRSLWGCNEETGMEDVEYYLQNYEEPVFCFSPDTTFPVCNGEKGVFSGNFIADPHSGNIIEFSGGIASNVVPDRAYCVVKGDVSQLSGTKNIMLSQQEDGTIRIEARGVGGHAAHPEDSLNSIGLLVEYLLANELCDKQERVFLELLQKLHETTDGKGLGIDCTDPDFSPLTCIGGMIFIDKNCLTQNINIRYPPSVTGADIQYTLQKIAEAHNAKFHLSADVKPFHIPADSAPIAVLQDTYNEITGENEKTYTMGGGTYARKFAHAVSFGPLFPGEERPNFVGLEHGANEGAHIESMLRALKIYILSLWRLMQLDY